MTASAAASPGPREEDGEGREEEGEGRTEEGEGDFPVATIDTVASLYPEPKMRALCGGNSKEEVEGGQKRGGGRGKMEQFFVTTVSVYRAEA